MKIAKRIAVAGMTGVVALAFGVGGASMASAAPAKKTTKAVVVAPVVATPEPAPTYTYTPVVYDANGNIVFPAPSKEPGLDPLPTN